jgi:hypothetical protein
VDVQEDLFPARVGWIIQARLRTEMVQRVQISLPLPMFVQRVDNHVVALADLAGGVHVGAHGWHAVIGFLPNAPKTINPDWADKPRDVPSKASEYTVNRQKR